MDHGLTRLLVHLTGQKTLLERGQSAVDAVARRSRAEMKMMGEEEYEMEGGQVGGK